MTIEITGAAQQGALRELVSRRLEAALGTLRVAPVRAQAAFFDDNGPKGGPGIRCAPTIRVPYRPAIRAEDRAATARAAFEGALAALERSLERYRERERDARRRPKKYFVAKRLA
jgi:ribosome-associated translation inhibitor RaiA